jgi:hypothetical protein
MRPNRSTGAVLAVLASLTVVSAKGMTTKIVVSGSDLQQPIELRDRDVLAPFNVWSGPGTSVNGVEGMDGFIVDWRSGAVNPPVTTLHELEIAFYANEDPSGSDRIVYVVSYKVDSSSGDGFVYLPGVGDPRYRSNVKSIIRGPQYEGHWFRASTAWQNVMRTSVLGRSALRQR